jgi:hypothetical protein
VHQSTRFIARRERPHPGAQLSLFDLDAGWRHQVMATDPPIGHGSIQFLEARHQAHARVEDRIRTSKDTGFGRFPSRLFAINQAWLERALTASTSSPVPSTCYSTATWPSRAEEIALRRRTDHPLRPPDRLRISEHWPWATDLATAFARLTALPLPLT